MYATPTLITEVLCLVTQVHTTALNYCYSELIPYTVLTCSYWISFHDSYQCQAINNTDYSCHITAIELA